MPAYAPQDQLLSERFGIDYGEGSVVSGREPTTTHALHLSPLLKGEGATGYDLLLVIKAVAIMVGYRFLSSNMFGQSS